MNDLVTSDQAKFKAIRSDRAWEHYTLQELANWVHLLLKRASHREDQAQQAKDLQDAQNYMLMMQAHFDEIVTNLTNK